jgi:hypothetical protein
VSPPRPWALLAGAPRLALSLLSALRLTTSLIVGEIWHDLFLTGLLRARVAGDGELRPDRSLMAIVRGQEQENDTLLSTRRLHPDAHISACTHQVFDLVALRVTQPASPSYY